MFKGVLYRIQKPLILTPLVALKLIIASVVMSAAATLEQKKNIKALGETKHVTSLDIPRIYDSLLLYIKQSTGCYRCRHLR